MKHVTPKTRTVRPLRFHPAPTRPKYAISLAATIPGATPPDVLFQSRDAGPETMIWCNVPGAGLGARARIDMHAFIASAKLTQVPGTEKTRYNIGLRLEDCEPATQDLLEGIDTWAASFLPPEISSATYRRILSGTGWANFNVPEDKWAQLVDGDGQPLVEREPPYVGRLVFAIRGIWRKADIGKWGLYLELERFDPVPSVYAVGGLASGGGDEDALDHAPVSASAAAQC